MPAIKRNFTLSSGIGISVDTAYVVNSTNSTTTTSGSMIITGGAGFGQSVSLGGRLQMFNGANYTAFVSSASGNTVYTLPATSPATGSSVLQSTSAGVLSWVPMVASSSGTTAANVNVVSAVTNSSHYLIFSPSSSGSGVALSTESSLVYNPSTDILSLSGLAITAGTASTTTANGALQVAGGVGISGRLVFNQSSFGTTGIGTNPSMAMIGQTGDPIFLTVLEDNSISFEGSQGQLFSITPNLSSGYIYSVNDITGIPLIRANANANVTANEYAGNFGIGLTNPGYKLHVLGSVGFTSTTASTSSSTGTLVVSGGVGIGGSLYVASATGISGVTINAGIITGSLSGLASSSSAIGVVNSLTNSAHTLLFSPLATGSGVAVSSNTVLTYNPSTSILSVSGLAVTSTTASISSATGSVIISGGVGIGQSLNTSAAYSSSVSGLAISNGIATGTLTGFASTGRNVNVVGAGTSNLAHYLLFSTASSTVSGAALSNDSTFSFNPSTEILSVSGLAVTAGTASTNSATGAVKISGGLGVSGQLSFNTASLGATGYSNPSIAFIGSTNSAPITLTVLTDNSLSWEGTSGSLFSIDNNLSTGDIFSVSDISGLPIISASAGQTVNINEFGGYTQIGNGSLNSSSTSTGSLVIAGGLGMTGNANIGGTVRLTNTTFSTSSSTGTLTVSGGAGIAQTLFVGGNISNANYFYSGGNNFTKSGQAQGDIFLDNNTNDTPGLLYYYKNNTNFGIDTYAVGIGATRLRIVRDLNESTGSEIWSIDRNGVVTRSAWDVGEVISTRVYNNSDLGMGTTTTINSTTYTNVAVITYTPKSSSSHLWIEFDANYDYSNGTTADDFFSRITVGGTVISEKNQIMVGQIGGGTRSGVIFPISGRYTNSSTSGIAITVQAKWGSADDAIRVYGSSTSGYMRIQEIGR